MLTSENSHSNRIVMKRLSTFMAAASAAAVLVSCAGAGQSVIVSNDTSLARQNETVELSFSELCSGDDNLTAENVIVLNHLGKQVPVQVYTEKDGEQILLFQADVKEHSSVKYTVKAGEREEFPMKAYSRYVPERLDDYAYENNLVAGRIYGPALQDPRTFGSDVWLKCTERLVIDDWFKKMDYHHNYGEGMDCYKVANTLGGGAVTPYVGEKLIIGDNWATQEHLTDAPIRTKAYFTYDAFDVAGQKVSATREISLDANSRFVQSTTWFSAQTQELPLALGAIQHDVLDRVDGTNWIAFTEVASDTKQPEIDGNISIGLVLSPELSAEGTATLDGHAVIKTTAKCGSPVTVWTASGWSQGGVESPQAWTALVQDFAYAKAHPLKVEVVK